MLGSKAGIPLELKPAKHKNETKYLEKKKLLVRLSFHAYYHFSSNNMC